MWKKEKDKPADFLKKILMFLNFIWGGGGAETERETRIQAPGSELSAQSLTLSWTQKPREHNLSWSWAINQLSHPGTPNPLIFKAQQRVISESIFFLEEKLNLPTLLCVVLETFSGDPELQNWYLCYSFYSMVYLHAGEVVAFEDWAENLNSNFWKMPFHC